MDREFLLRMSYMEIYNEEINDLLAPEHRKLQIHENLEVFSLLLICFYPEHVLILYSPAILQSSVLTSLKARDICCWVERRNCRVPWTSSWFHGVWRMYAFVLPPFILLVLFILCIQLLHWHYLNMQLIATLERLIWMFTVVGLIQFFAWYTYYLSFFV